MSSSWQHSELFQTTNLHMLENEILCDITLLAGATKEPVKCHKFVLASRSPVFYAMFCGSLPETNDVIEIPDIEATAFKEFVRFLYTGDCTIIAENVLQLLYAARKYNIALLAKQCTSYLEQRMTTDNVCTILNHAILFDEVNLQTDCLQLLEKHTAEVINKESIVNMSEKAFELFLRLKYVNCDETDMYKACKDWAKAACMAKGQDGNDQQVRETLRDLIFLVRFPTMSIKTFTDVVSAEAVLSAQEKVDIYRSITNNVNESKFPSVLRLNKAKLGYVNRFSVKDGYWSHSGKPDGIRFRVSEYTSLVAVKFYLPSEDGKTEGSFEIYENNTKLLTQLIKLEFQLGKALKIIDLSSSVKLDPKKTYSLCQRFTGANTWKGVRGERNIMACGNKVLVEFSNLTKAVGKSRDVSSVSTGQIHGIVLYYNPK